MELPDGMLRVKTLNLNAFYTFNSRHFSCLTFLQGHPLLHWAVGESEKKQNYKLK